MTAIGMWIGGFVLGVLFHVPAKLAFQWVYNKVMSKIKKD